MKPDATQSGYITWTHLGLLHGTRMSPLLTSPVEENKLKPLAPPRVSFGVFHDGKEWPRKLSLHNTWGAKCISLSNLPLEQPSPHRSVRFTSCADLYLANAQYAFLVISKFSVRKAAVNYIQKQKKCEPTRQGGPKQSNAVIRAACFPG